MGNSCSGSWMAVKNQISKKERGMDKETTTGKKGAANKKPDEK